MSVTILKLIPTFPSFNPVEVHLKDAITVLKGFLPFAEITVQLKDRIEFIDQGQNFEHVTCNVCGHEIDIDYWQEAMDTSFDSNFSDLNFITPCCENSVSLNDLKYHSPAGFARFYFEINKVSRELNSDEVFALETALTTPIRQIWARY